MSEPESADHALKIIESIDLTAGLDPIQSGDGHASSKVDLSIGPRKQAYDFRDDPSRNASEPSDYTPIEAVVRIGINEIEYHPTSLDDAELSVSNGNRNNSHADSYSTNRRNKTYRLGWNAFGGRIFLIAAAILAARFETIGAESFSPDCGRENVGSQATIEPSQQERDRADQINEQDKKKNTVDNINIKDKIGDRNNDVKVNNEDRIGSNERIKTAILN